MSFTSLSWNRPHIREKRIEVSRDDWGKTTLVTNGPDPNELFFWVTESEFAKLESELADRKS